MQQANESGQPLRSVFESLGRDLGRKPNSVRNYYYMQLRAREGAQRRAAPFEPFQEEEVRALCKDVLRARAGGQSVRAAVMALSSGDRARMLRYQNKYRSVLKRRPELIRELMKELSQEGVSCPDPLSPAPPAENVRTRAEAKAALLQDADARRLFSALDALLDRALENDPQTRRDRLRVQLDMAALRYDDLCHAAGDMLLMCKEFLGQQEETRAAVLPAFMASLADHVARVENAMQ